MSCVCKHWQDVALSTPTLWTSVHVWDWTALDWLQKRISLSKESPLDIQVELSEDVAEMPEDMMDLLAAEARRWRNFDCTFQSDIAADEILSQFKGIQAPLLEKLTLVDDSTSEFRSFYHAPTVYQLFDGPGSLPKLRSASLWSVPLEWDTNPFQNLRELELCYMPDSGFGDPNIRKQSTDCQVVRCQTRPRPILGPTASLATARGPFNMQWGNTASRT